MRLFSFPIFQRTYLVYINILLPIRLENGEKRIKVLIKKQLKYWGLNIFVIFASELNANRSLCFVNKNIWKRQGETFRINTFVSIIFIVQCAKKKPNFKI